MQAIILAAGLGKRLKDLTKENTKCMVKVNGKSLIEHSLDILSQNEISRIVLVIGFKGDNVKALLGDQYKGIPIEYVENPIYDKTNNIYSLYLAKEYLKEEDSLLLESDLIFEEGIIDRLLKDPFPNLAAVSKYESWMDGTVVTINGDNDIVQFIPKKNFRHEDIQSYFKTVNIYKFSKGFSEKSYVPFLEAYTSALGQNEYYEQVLRIITLLERQDLKALVLHGEKWYEIDDMQDLHNAETIFSAREKKKESFHRRFGGYWRFPDVLDFCYLVNPYFPPVQMENEIKCYFSDLMRQYPSGQSVQQILATRMFDCEKDQIIVGNGAAELIKELVEEIKGTVGVICPTFNEYPERIGEERVRYFFPTDSTFRYGIKELREFAKDVDNLLVINPDNPSGNFIPKEELLPFIEELGQQGKSLILDESFVDFADGAVTNTLICKDYLKRYQNLCIVKSISKSYGVPGFRLGVLASGNIQLIDAVRRRVAIWNINSYGEFFMQIFPKYEEKYLKGCEEIARERTRFFEALSGISFLEVYPSQANYFLCRVIDRFSSDELTRILLDRNLLIKDCKGKKGFEKGEFIRLAIRDKKDNDNLLSVLKEL